jgi:copper chaperone CopZ
MKNTSLIFLFIIATTVTSFAQNTSKIKVAGNCGMCKKNIETAAKAAGAMTAAWDKTTKVLTVAFDATATSKDKIEIAIANAGYDTEHQVASNEAYGKLDECCQYERKKKKKS